MRITTDDVRIWSVTGAEMTAASPLDRPISVAKEELIVVVCCDGLSCAVADTPLTLNKDEVDMAANIRVA